MTKSSSRTASYDAKKDSFYNTYANKTNYKVKTPKTLPDLYLAVRNYAVNNYGYQVFGTNAFNIECIINGVAQML